MVIVVWRGALLVGPPCGRREPASAATSAAANCGASVYGMSVAGAVTGTRRARMHARSTAAAVPRARLLAAALPHLELRVCLTHSARCRPRRAAHLPLNGGSRPHLLRSSMHLGHRPRTADERCPHAACYAVQVLSHICERVKTLHDAGVAHRDLKPGNVLWRPKHYSWTLIDFGCAAKIGAHPDRPPTAHWCMARPFETTPAVSPVQSQRYVVELQLQAEAAGERLCYPLHMGPRVRPPYACVSRRLSSALRGVGAVSRLTFSVSYSPPETLMTLRSGARSIKSDPATDIWAIGLVAYELIHRQRAFREFSWTFTDVLDAAAGAKAYPWEERPGTFKRDPELRALGSVVRACLARDAAARPTAEQLVQKFHRLFDGTTMGPGTQTSGAEPSVPMPEADAFAQTRSADAESVDAEAGSEPPAVEVLDPRTDSYVARGVVGVRPPPGINAAVRTRTHTHSRIELNSLQPSSVLATTAEVRDDGEFDQSLQRALAHAWGPSTRLATTLEGNEETAETATTGTAADGSDVPPMHIAASLQTSSALVTTAETAGGNSSLDTTRAAGGGGPIGPAECAVSAHGADSAAAGCDGESRGDPASDGEPDAGTAPEPRGPPDAQGGS